MHYSTLRDTVYCDIVIITYTGESTQTLALPGVANPETAAYPVVRIRGGMTLTKCTNFC